VFTPSRGLQLNGYRENPPKKNDCGWCGRTSSSGPAKGLKEGYVRCEARIVFVEKKRMGGERFLFIYD